VFSSAQSFMPNDMALIHAFAFGYGAQAASGALDTDSTSIVTPLVGCSDLLNGNYPRPLNRTLATCRVAGSFSAPKKLDPPSQTLTARVRHASDNCGCVVTRRSR
jgi:hypothetical protein